MPYTLEVCVDSVASALAAKRGGADRLELCADLIIGGTTPSLALVRQVKAETGLPVRALLRPRFGDFCYDRYELAQMAETAAALAEKAKITVHPGSSFRHLAVQSDADIDGIVLAPPHDHLNEKIGPLLPSGCANAEVLLGLMRKAAELLPGHPINKKREAEGKLPANCIWFWAEGKGLEPVSVPTATGEWDTDYEAKTAAALDVLAEHDFAAIHLEGPDEATHNHDLEHKIYSVECLSERVAKPLCAALRERGEDFRLLILSDHRTFMANGAHGGTPVPYMIYDSREMGPASGLGYTEKNGESGPFLESGVELMPRLFCL